MTIRIDFDPCSGTNDPVHGSMARPANRVTMVELAVIGLVGGLVIGLVHTDEERSRIIGILCIIFNLAMSGSPLTIAVRLSSPSPIKKNLVFYISYELHF